MNKHYLNKKTWIKPDVRVLRIKKDTFSGSISGAEIAGKSGLPQKF